MTYFLNDKRFDYFFDAMNKNKGRRSEIRLFSPGNFKCKSSADVRKSLADVYKSLADVRKSSADVRISLADVRISLGDIPN
jgi:hypothetical protein